MNHNASSDAAVFDVLLATATRSLQENLKITLSARWICPPKGPREGPGAEKKHQTAHVINFKIDVVLKTLVPKCNVVIVDHLTEGAACTTLLAKEYFNDDKPLLFANSDQYVDWNSTEFLYKPVQ